MEPPSAGALFLIEINFPHLDDDLHGALEATSVEGAPDWSHIVVIAPGCNHHILLAVSYTHLTLPTSDLV